MEEEKTQQPPTPIFDDEPIGHPIAHPLHRCNAATWNADGTWSAVNLVADDPSSEPTISYEPTVSYGSSSARSRFVKQVDAIVERESAERPPLALSFVSHNHVLAKFSFEGTITEDDLKKLIALPIAISTPSCLLQLRLKSRNIYSQDPSNNVAAVVSVGQACADERYMRHVAICGDRPCDYERDLVVAWDSASPTQLLEIRITNTNNLLKVHRNEDKEICIVFEGYTFVK